MSGFSVVFLSSLLLSGLTASPGWQAPPFDVGSLLSKLSTKFASARECMFEGNLLLEGQRAAAPLRVLSKAKVRFAQAQPGKSFLWLDAQDKDEYSLISDGQKSWAWVPKRKQYTEIEAAVLTDEGEDEDASRVESDQERDPAEGFARDLVPMLGRLRATAAGAEVSGLAEVKYLGKKVKWPTVRVLSKKDDRQGQNLTELTMDPTTLAIGRMVWINVTYREGERYLIRATMDFTSLQVGEKLPDSTFAFEPPKNAKLVDALPIPGQTGSFLVDRPAPDFELHSLDGKRIKLSDLRGHPVLLDFWASWCGPCRQELPGLVHIHDEYQDKGLIVLGVNDELRATARRFVFELGISFPTLDDSGLTVHHLYRVDSIPSVFLIDAQGKIVRFFVGARSEITLRAALRGVGLQ